MKISKTAQICLLTLFLIILLELNSFITHVFFPIKIPATLILAVLVFVLTFYKPEIGVFFVLGELAIGGKGYLLDLSGLSLRIIIFATVFIAFTFNRLKNTDWRKINKEYFQTYLPFVILIIALFFGAINGILNNEIEKVYADGNAWLFFLLLPVFISTAKTPDFFKRSLIVLLTASTWLALKTILFLFIFSNQYAFIGDSIYAWIRNSGVGEITYISGNNFRIFFYSQIYCLISIFAILVIFLNNQIKKIKQYLFYYFVIFFQLFALLISQSRSFWLAGFFSFFIMAIFYFIISKKSIGKLCLISLLITLTIIGQIFLTQVITNSLFNNRLGNLNTEPAGVSRLNQLKPLSENILKNPVFGYGFGKTLTYKSQDPRILKTNPTGNYTTFAFEWGYLDLWLKIGLIGLVGYLIIFLFMLLQNKNKIDNNFKYWFLFGLLCLGLVNIFTPYLNHPLGIGYILLSYSFFSKNQTMC